MEVGNIESRKQKEHVMVDVDESKTTYTHRASQGAVVVSKTEGGAVKVEEEEKKKEEEERREKVERMGVCIAIGNWDGCKTVVQRCVDDGERQELFNNREEHFKRSFFRLAIKAGDLPLCKLVVNACRDDFERRMLLNAIMECNDTALHYAAWKGHEDIIQWLLSNDEGGGRRLGFDRLMARNKNLETALHVAARKNHPRACQVLLDGCRDSRERIALIQAVNDKGRTIIHFASRFRSVGVIKWILQSPEMQFIYNLKDNNGFTALHLMILDNRRHAMTSLADVVNALLFDTEAESQAIIIDNDNRKDRKRIATKIDPNIGCGLDWNH